MIIYILIYLPFVLCSYYDFFNAPMATKKRVMGFFVIVFTLFRGLRWDTGTDWKQFLDVFEHSYFTNIFNFERGSNLYGDTLMEPGYVFINAIFHEIGLNYTIFLLVTNFLIMRCYYIFCIKHTRYPVMALICLISVGIPFPVRQTISFALIIWAYCFLAEKKYIYYVLIILAASAIHRSALFCIAFLPLPWLVNKWKIPWYVYGGVYTATFFIPFILGQNTITMLSAGATLIGGSTDVYLESYTRQEGTSVDFGHYESSLLGGISFAVFFIALLFMAYKEKAFSNRSIRYFNFFFFLYALAASINNLISQTEASGITEVLQRIISLFDMLPLLLPLVFIWLAEKYNRVIFFLCFCIYMMYKFYGQIPNSFFHDLYIPYKSIF